MVGGPIGEGQGLGRSIGEGESVWSVSYDWFKYVYDVMDSCVLCFIDTVLEFLNIHSSCTF